MKQEFVVLESKKNVTLFFILIFSLGLGIRFWYFPLDVPIAGDGFFSFIYSMKTVFDGNLPIDYTTTNTGWANFLSIFFSFSNTTEPLQLMNIQRMFSSIVSVLTMIPAFFIFRRFVSEKLALFGCLMFVIEPRMILISLEGIDFTLFLFTFMLSLGLFLKGSKTSLFCSFLCIAITSLIRYEAILLLIPFSIMFFLRFKKRKDVLKFVGLIFTVLIILVPVSMLRIDATQDYCYDSIFGVQCGKDGIVNNLLDRVGSVNDKIIGIPDIDDPIYNTEAPMIDHFIFLSFTNLAKFLGIVLIPYFFIFLVLRIIRLKTNIPRINWELGFIIFTTCVALLPAIYAYGRGIEEYRYVLVAIPLICIISISGINSISKIKSNRNILLILISIVILTSLSFLELEKRDNQYDRESFMISQEIISLTDKINIFEYDKFIKTALIINDWPELPESNKVGKPLDTLEEKFQKVSVNNFDTIESFVISSESLDLKYFVVDQKEELFEDLRKNPNNYPFFDLRFDSSNHGYENRFLIYEIDFNEFKKENETNNNSDRLN